MPGWSLLSQTGWQQVGGVAWSPGCSLRQAGQGKAQLLPTQHKPTHVAQGRPRCKAELNRPDFSVDHFKRDFKLKQYLLFKAKKLSVVSSTKSLGVYITYRVFVRKSLQP